MRAHPAVAAVALALASVPAAAGAQSINNHAVVLDGTGKLLSWLPQETAYGQIVGRVWNGFLNGVPSAPAPNSSRKAYYHYPYMNVDKSLPNWPHSPAGTYSMLTDSATLSYPFTGDAAMMAAVKGVLLYHLANGMTAPGDSWSSVNYAEADAGDTTYAGASSYGSGIGDGAGVLEPDKVAELGLAWLTFWKFDGTVAFRDAAIQNANVLAARRRAGTSATVSPWPFRVRASDNAVVEEYCSHVVAAIALWDELIRLGLGDTATYASARAAVWTWMMTYPMQNGVWSKYFEDMSYADTSSRNQYLPGNTARYLLEHPALDPAWEAHARSLVAWIETNFGKPLVYGARPIGEQTLYDIEMGSHTSRYGAVNALLYERTGDAAAREKAFRALNWASYQNRTDGLTVDNNPTPNQIWFTDGFGDYARHFMIAMGAVPEWAPPGENHLLRSTSVVQSVGYLPNRVDYVTFDAAAQEVLRLTFTPANVLADDAALPERADLSAPGWTFDAAPGVLRIRHDAATRIAVVGGPSPLPVSISPATASTPPRGRIAFSASGGSGSGWSWALTTNASGGSIDAGTGAYQAGPAGDVGDVVRVADSLGNSATRSVAVTAGVSISPASARVPPRGGLAFGASGGSGSGWSWALTTNASGGSIDAATGLYRAGAAVGVTDVVQVVDSLGNSASGTVEVAADVPSKATASCSCAAGSVGLELLAALGLLPLRRGRRPARRHAEP